MKIKILITLNSILRKILKYVRIRKYRKLLGVAKKAHPEYFLPIDPKIEKKHKRFWSQLHKPVHIDYLRYFSNYSKNHDYRYLPTDIYTAIIERILNDPNTGNYDMDKNRLDLIIGPDNCPIWFLKNVNGIFLDEKNKVIAKTQAEIVFNNLGKDFIIKPSINTRRGSNVNYYKFKEKGYYDFNENRITLDYLCKAYKMDFIIQEVIQQHPGTARFNKSSVNSIRINTYRSVTTEEVHIINTFFKIGREDSIVDNTYAGGLWINIKDDGNLAEVAFTTIKPMTKHPDSGITLKDQPIPHMDKIISLAKDAAKKIANHRLLAFDIAIDSNIKPVVLEVNILGIGVGQWDGGPFFKDFTHEIVDYCINHRDEDNFAVFRL